MAIIRTRFLFWLIKAYLKKWGKTVIVSFLVGLAFFFLLLKLYPVLYRALPLGKKVIVGMTGAYTVDGIPTDITKKISRGLTTVDDEGTVKPDLASSWEITDEGKTYIFHLRRNLSFSNGTRFTAKTINYRFADVSVKTPDDYTIIYSLKDSYSPFLVTVSKPILLNGYVGIGEYKINNIELNGDFIKSLQLQSNKNRFLTELYIFYPSNEALKTAFVLGEVTRTIGLTDTKIKNSSIEQFPNIVKKEKVSYQKLVAIFFNTADSVLSDKRLRSGLAYAIPDEFAEGQRVYFPYPPKSRFYNTELGDQRHDMAHAQLLIESSLKASSSSAIPVLKLKTLAKYKKTAMDIASAWKQLGIETDIEEVESVPQVFQIYIGDFNIPKDPDQYTLWHSNQPNNITKFTNLRIDKLLEDGRKVIDVNERVRIYYDFQKYLIDESPAAFLYFPYEYEFARK